ncbi:monovalent cation/H(+) antiporter subunit G [Actibacterium sp. 188UL27-1]|uniref:monovalent cation/H(+) antiporter subunit G n=1 Tax=Actibacterium sp. 188UL27-1 TaxID=2786961 RepID=UPI001EF5EE0A|nr:monovalent cation/H(+) antiporter subunit G [Actibacterium sp. 188UL27-1]
MIEVIAGVLILLGAGFALIAALGVLRLPDVLTRMHASTKAGTLGSSLILVAAAVVFAETEITVRVIATILFLMLTAPIGAHMIGRAAVRKRQPEEIPEQPQVTNG